MYEIFVYKNETLVFSIKINSKTDAPGIWDEFVADDYEVVIKNENGEDDTEYFLGRF